MIQLKPCPFCGGEEVEFMRTYNHDLRGPDKWFVACTDCKGCGAALDEQSKAAVAWNHRADLARAVEAGFREGAMLRDLQEIATDDELWQNSDARRKLEEPVWEAAKAEAKRRMEADNA